MTFLLYLKIIVILSNSKDADVLDILLLTI